MSPSTLTASELAEILRLHALWLDASTAGKRADLRGADLIRANLIRANLTGVKGLICMHVHHPAGYRPVAVQHADGWRIYAGCRAFTVAEALAHWGAADYHTPDLGAAYVRAITEQLG